MPRLRLLLLLALFAGSAGPLSAQTATPLDPHHIDASTIGPPIDIGETWLAHQGDDPSYADPHLDDSQWAVITTHHSLQRYIPNPDRLWYRTHVQVPPSSRNLGLRLSGFRGSYQMLVNGKQIYASDSFPAGGSRLAHYTDGVVSIPDALIGTGDLTIAIRAHIRYATIHGWGGLLYHPLVLLGPAQQLRDGFELQLFQRYSSHFLTLELQILLLITSVGLALIMRSDREYLAMAIFVSASLLYDCWVMYRVLHGFVRSPAAFTPDLLLIVQAIAEIEFCRRVLGFRRSRVVIAYEWAYAAVMSVCTLANVLLLILDRYSRLGRYIRTSTEVVTLPIHFGLPLLALWAWRKRRNRYALLLLAPLVVNAWYDIAAFVPYARMVLTGAEGYRPIGSTPIPYFGVAWNEIAESLFLLSLLIFVVVRAILIARSRAALATEVKAAQTVQQLLLARSAEPTPGFIVDTVYLPASEVGGDFFLVSPAPDGSVVALVGDVSGKGLLAAMRVSMILGILRRESSRVPAVILANLNHALRTQSEMGFTTACCVRLERDGQFTLANAGQISPYVDGQEIDTISGLPLGLAADQEYPETSGQLSPAQKLVLTSDGVVEARNSKGELYGFERLGPLTRESARDIAVTAQTFGQHDDITVLTVAPAA